MPKVMLVEDDNNLREIYEARLKAEGYDIISAKDGEEALVIAKAEKPDLVISDVMMPKISGFEMLDILRNTEELKTVKVIMLTALGQSDDQLRADKLGADRYLVKSQVTLEDIVKVAHELLQDMPAAEASAPAAPAPTAPEPVAAAPAEPVAPAPAPPAPAPEPVVPVPAPVVDAPAAPASTPPVAAPTVTDVPAATPQLAPAPAAVPVTPAPAPEPITMAASSAQEEAEVEAKIEDFVAGATEVPTVPKPEPVPATPAPTPEEIAANTLKDDALMSKAVDTLVNDAQGSSDDATSKTDTTVAETTSAPEAPADVEETTVIKPTSSTELPPVAEEAAAEAEPDSPTGSVPIAHKKVINPIDTTPKQDIQTLLALEEAKAAAAAPPPPPTALIDNGEGAKPTPVPTDVPVQAPATDFAAAQQPAAKPEDKPATPQDPNSIAL